MSCAECQGDLPTVCDVEEFQAARQRHPSTLQQRIEEIRAKQRDQQERRRGILKLIRSA